MTEAARPTLGVLNRQPFGDEPPLQAVLPEEVRYLAEAPRNPRRK